MHCGDFMDKETSAGSGRGRSDGSGKTEQRPVQWERTDGAVLVAGPRLLGASGWRMRPTFSFGCIDIFEIIGHIIPFQIFIVSPFICYGNRNIQWRALSFLCSV